MIEAIRSTSSRSAPTGGRLDGSCPHNICTGVAHGKYIKPTRDWRVVVMSSMTKDDVRTLPMPPTEVFLMPDGKYPTK